MNITNLMKFKLSLFIYKTYAYIGTLKAYVNILRFHCTQDMDRHYISQGLHKVLIKVNISKTQHAKFETMRNICIHY